MSINLKNVNDQVNVLGTICGLMLDPRTTSRTNKLLQDVVDHQTTEITRILSSELLTMYED